LTQIRIELKLDLTQLSQIRLKLVDLLYNSPAWLKTHSDGADVTAMTRSLSKQQPLDKGNDVRFTNTLNKVCNPRAKSSLGAEILWPVERSRIQFLK